MSINSSRPPRAAAVIFSMSVFTLALAVIFGGSAVPGNAYAETVSFGNMKSVDVMKYTKDVMTNQQSDSVIDNLISTLKTLGITHIAISIPMDQTSDYPSGSAPSPRTAEAFTQKWANAIHSAGLKIIWRGTFSGIEGIYNFSKKVGSNRFPAGTALSAESDGTSSWLGKIYKYIVNNPGYFAAGDVWAPLPERTEGIFSDSTSFLPYDGAGIQANYASFFKDMKAVSDKAFSVIGKSVLTGLTANNYSEVASSWIPQTLFDTVGYSVVDHYGINHTTAEMDTDLRKIRTSRGKPVFLQEWGDYWTQSMDQTTRTAYLNSMYDTLGNLAADGVLIGFNSWTGWSGAQESILTQDSTGFHLNFAGEALKNFFGGISTASSSGDSATSSSTSASSLTTATTTSTSTDTSTGTNENYTVTYPPPVTSSASCPGAADGVFTGCYFRDTALTSLAFTRTDITVNFDWGLSSPDASMLADNFSARWQGNFSFESGDYEFIANSDDGIRVFVDGVKVIDAWYPQVSSAPHTYLKNMSAGSHLVVVEYYEATGAAVAKVSWSKAQTPEATNGFAAIYYQGTNFQKTVLVRNEPKIDFSWGSESPDSSVPDNNFSSRWTGNFDFSAGKHGFTMTADDGARLYIDGRLVIDAWREQPMSIYRTEVDLGAGIHTVKMEYYEKSGNASARLTWN